MDNSRRVRQVIAARRTKGADKVERAYQKMEHLKVRCSTTHCILQLCLTQRRCQQLRWAMNEERKLKWKHDLISKHKWMEEIGEKLERAITPVRITLLIMCFEL